MFAAVVHKRYTQLRLHNAELNDVILTVIDGNGIQ